jgi:uncharacterized protein YprB with RNaseH-like and TPR domain
MSDALHRKLKRLGVVKGAQELQKPPEVRVPSVPSETRPLPGQEMQMEYGTFWLDKRVYTPGYQHGNYALSQLEAVEDNYLPVFGVPSLGASPAFIDTETTGLVGGAGTIAFLIGIGVWEKSSFVLHLVFIRNPDEEAAALQYVADVLESCSGLVTFNGRSFDLPIMQTRFIINRLIPNWLDYPHLDLLAVARRLWRDHLPSRRLGEIEEKVLGISRTEEDLPSYLIPFFYRQYLETGQTAEMRRVMYHNEIDILSLVTLLLHVTRMVSQPEEMNLAPAEWAGVGDVFFKSGAEHEALGAWEQALGSLPGALPASCTSRLCSNMGLYYKRRVRWDKAIALWDTWVENVPHAVKPLVEKAKYYEWTARNAEQALRMTENAISRVEQHFEGLSQEKRLKALLHRKNRLTLKLKFTVEGEDTG